MIQKRADDKSKRIDLLEDLQKSNLLDFLQKKWLREELSRFKKGIQGERDSAYYLDSYFKNGENHVVLHDLRFIVDGDVAQIDHLIINRAFGIYLIETKNYSGNLVINDCGEFTVNYDQDSFGVPSPLEQSHRHERILARLLERLDIVGRTQRKTDFHHVVMLHPKAIIERPDTRKFDTSNVIKADQFPSWHARYTEKATAGAVFKLALNMRSIDTIKEWGEKLARQHRPADLFSLPEFMRPKAAPTTTPPAPRPFPAAEAPQSDTPIQATAKSASPTDAPEPAKKLICAKCSIKITYPEGKFCWNNEKRFGGRQYCREHQALF